MLFQSHNSGLIEFLVPNLINFADFIILLYLADTKLARFILQIMADVSIEKQRFEILDVDGENYLVWQNDVLLHLQARSLEHTITVAHAEEADQVDEANAMIFFRHHMS